VAAGKGHNKKGGTGDQAKPNGLSSTPRRERAWSFFRPPTYGISPQLGRVTYYVSSEVERFMSFVVNTAFWVLLTWSLFFYLCICLPGIRWLQLCTVVSFLLIPSFFLMVEIIYNGVEIGHWNETQLGSLRWAFTQWVREFADLMFKMIVVSSLVYLLLRLLMNVFVWPNAFFAWVVARVDALLGLSLGTVYGLNSMSWLGGWPYAILAGLWLLNLLFLLTALLHVTRLAVMSDLEFIGGRILSPALYGGLRRFLLGSFVIALVLTVVGAALKVIAGIAAILHFTIPYLEPDLLVEVLSRGGKAIVRSHPSWLGSLHLPVALTIIRTVIPRLVYAKKSMSVFWSREFAYLGFLVLVLPLFFQSVLHDLPLGHFYDGYVLSVAQWIYAIVYVGFLLPAFGLMLRSRS